MAAGQQAENLLYVCTKPIWDSLLTYHHLSSDFDDSTNIEGQPSGLAATQVLSQTPAAANLLSGTSNNPLDDLVSIFGGGGGALTSTPPVAFGSGGAFMATGPAFGGAPMTPAPPTPAPARTNSQSQQDDLLGLF